MTPRAVASAGSRVASARSDGPRVDMPPRSLTPLCRRRRARTRAHHDDLPDTAERVEWCLTPVGAFLGGPQSGSLVGRWRRKRSGAARNERSEEHTSELQSLM